MDHLIGAFLLGLAGSLHCAGMCGPLLLAMPRLGGTAWQVVASRGLYNAGRVVTYVALGGVFGLAGKSLALVGFQRWLSIGAGLAILAGLAASGKFGASATVVRMVGGLKSALGGLLHRRSAGAIFLLGLLNGLLPCGLVYVAAAAAAAEGGAPAGMLFMAAFGAGTVPMMLAIGLGSPHLASILGGRARSFAPTLVMVMGLLLIMRGLGLGIPYLSPDLNAAGVACH